MSQKENHSRRTVNINGHPVGVVRVIYSAPIDWDLPAPDPQALLRDFRRQLSNAKMRRKSDLGK